MTALALRVVIVGFASYRLARAVAVDSITLPVREWLYARAYPSAPPMDLDADPELYGYPNRPWAWLYGLVSCPFCIGFWLALGIAAAWFGAWTVAFFVAAIASAGVNATLSAFDHRMMS